MLLSGRAFSLLVVAAALSGCCSFGDYFADNETTTTTLPPTTVLDLDPFTPAPPPPTQPLNLPGPTTQPPRPATSSTTTTTSTTTTPSPSTTAFVPRVFVCIDGTWMRVSTGGFEPSGDPAPCESLDAAGIQAAVTVFEECLAGIGVERCL